MVQILSINNSTLWGDVALSDVAALTFVMPSAAPSSTMHKVALNVDDEDEGLDKETNEKGLRKDEPRIVETLTELHET